MQRCGTLAHSEKNRCNSKLNFKKRQEYFYYKDTFKIDIFLAE